MTRSKAIWTIICLAILSVFFALQLPDLKFNYVFEDFFPVDDPELAFYQEFKSDFGEDNNYLLLGLIPSEGVFNNDFLNSVDSLSRILEEHPSIISASSLTNARRPLITPTGLITLPLVHPEDSDRLSSDSLFILSSPLLRGNLVSLDGRSTAILVRHVFLPTQEEAGELLRFIDQSLNKIPDANWHIAGKIHAQKVFVDTMQDELVTFLSASAVLIILFLGITYRSLWLIILPLVVVALGAVWILGIMSLAGKPLDILMVLLPTIMFVVGMSDVVHLMTKYIEQLRLGYDQRTAIRVTFREVGLATFLTSLTTAVGFFTLLTASIRPIREFGIYTGIGVFIAFIVAFTLIPASLSLMKPPAVSKKLYNRSSWVGFLGKGFIFSLRRAKTLLAIALVLIIVSVAGTKLITINTYLIEDLPSDHPLKEDFTFFDENFGGSRPFEMTMEIPEGSSLFDPEVIYDLEELSDYLKETYEVGNLVSPVTLVKSLNQAAQGGGMEFYKLPETAQQWKRINRFIPSVVRSSQMKSFFSEDQKTARISGRVEDIGSAISLKRTDSLRQFINQNMNSDLARYTVTGTSNLIDKNNEYLARNMFAGLGIAFAVVALIAGILYRSIRMVIITLIPNVIPLLIVAAIMGVTGITLKLSTSIVFTIAFGIAVDDTIHFISKLKIELSKGSSLLYALKRTYLTTGKAIIVTSIILSGGFMTLLLSSFGGTFYTGLLISLTLILALIIDLTLLPVLVFLFYNKNRKSDAAT
jgi:predicted RND superfamily exporter protein